MIRGMILEVGQVYRASHGLSEVPPAGPEGDPYEAYGYDGEDGDDVLTLASTWLLDTCYQFGYGQMIQWDAAP